MARVLVCDDAVFMRKVLADQLVRWGHEIVGEAQSGSEAVEQYRELTPDLVTMDITMPEMDGIGAVKGIMTINPNALVVMVSALGQQDMVKEAILAGAKDFIVKPFAPDRVEAAIKRVLASAA